jgi:hypothetical protein
LREFASLFKEKNENGIEQVSLACPVFAEKEILSLLLAILM